LAVSFTVAFAYVCVNLHAVAKTSATFHAVIDPSWDRASEPVRELISQSSAGSAGRAKAPASITQPMAS
jgi:hypothetical protein